jgi:hypothetical protein
VPLSTAALPYCLTGWSRCALRQHELQSEQYYQTSSLGACPISHVVPVCSLLDRIENIALLRISV